MANWYDNILTSDNVKGLLNGGLNYFAGQSQQNQNQDAANQYTNATKFVPFSVVSGMGSSMVDPTNKTATLSLNKPYQDLSNNYLSMANGINSNLNAFSSGDPVQAYLDKLRALSAPQNSLDRTNLESRLFSQGLLGSTGGGIQQKALYDSQNQQDLQAQIASMNNAQDYMHSGLVNSGLAAGASTGLINAPMDYLKQGSEMGTAASNAAAPAALNQLGTSSNAPNSASFWQQLLGGMLQPNGGSSTTTGSNSSTLGGMVGKLGNTLLNNIFTTPSPTTDFGWGNTNPFSGNGMLLDYGNTGSPSVPDFTDPLGGSTTGTTPFGSGSITNNMLHGAGDTLNLLNPNASNLSKAGSIYNLGNTFSGGSLGSSALGNGINAIGTTASTIGALSNVGNIDNPISALNTIGGLAKGASYLGSNLLGPSFTTSATGSALGTIGSSIAGTLGPAGAVLAGLKLAFDKGGLFNDDGGYTPMRAIAEAYNKKGPQGIIDSANQLLTGSETNSHLHDQTGDASSRASALMDMVNKGIINPSALTNFNSLNQWQQNQQKNDPIGFSINRKVKDAYSGSLWNWPGLFTSKTDYSQNHKTGKTTYNYVPTDTLNNIVKYSTDPKIIAEAQRRLAMPPKRRAI